MMVHPVVKCAKMETTKRKKDNLFVKCVMSIHLKNYKHLMVIILNIDAEYVHMDVHHQQVLPYVVPVVQDE